MSNLTKEQKDELVTSYAALALYDGDVSAHVHAREGFIFVMGEAVHRWLCPGVTRVGTPFCAEAGA